MKWICERYENLHQEQLGDGDKKALAREMLKSQNFDHFLATKFASVKRYGGEGAEGMMGFFTESLLNANIRKTIDFDLLVQALLSDSFFVQVVLGPQHCHRQFQIFQCHVRSLKKGQVAI